MKKDNACNVKRRRKSKEIHSGSMQPIGCNLHLIRLELTQETTIRSDGAQTDRMEGDCSYKFTFIGEFTPHNHVWLIISA